MPNNDNLKIYIKKQKRQFFGKEKRWHSFNVQIARTRFLAKRLNARTAKSSCIRSMGCANARNAKILSASINGHALIAATSVQKSIVWTNYSQVVLSKVSCLRCVLLSHGSV